MKKLVWGILYVLLGIIWTVVLLSAAFTEPTDLFTTIVIFVLFVPTGVALIYKGISKIIHYRQVSSPDIAVFNDETILAKWEITGREWERFKEQKCTPEAINRASALYTVFVGLGAGGFMMLVFHDQPLEILLSTGAIFAFIGAAVSFYFIRKTEFNKYGFANDMKTGVLTLTHEFADFCGKIVPLNTSKRWVIKVQLMENPGYSYLFFRISEYRWWNRNYVFYEDAKKLLEENRFDAYYVSEKGATETMENLQKRYPFFFRQKKTINNPENRV